MFQNVKRQALIYATLASLLPLFSLAWGYPSQANTGVLKERCPDWMQAKKNTKGRTITQAGTVIANEEVTGQLTISAPDVTIKCTKINASGALYGIHCFTSKGCPGLLTEDSEVYNCSSSCVNLKGLPGKNAVLRRSYLHHAERDLAKSEGYSEFLDNYLSDSYDCPVCPQASDAHSDGLQVAKGENIIISRNTIQGPHLSQTSAILIRSSQGPINRVRIDHNLISGGSFTIYVRGGASYPMPDNVVVAGNRFLAGTAKFGLHSLSSVAGCMEWYGNYTQSACTDISPPPGISVPGRCMPPWSTHLP